MNLKGAYTAIVTPFNDENEINWEVYDELIDFQLTGGISGIVPCGTTGESPVLTTTEKIDLIRRTVEKCQSRASVIAGTGSNNTQATIEFSKKAIALDVDALMIITPYYNKPGQKGLYLHFSEIAKAIAPFPFIIYNVPSRTNVHIEAKTVHQLHLENHNLVGIKDASGDFDYLIELKRLLPDNFNILCGEDGLLLPYSACGASGIVSVASNIIPGKMNALCKLISDKNSEEQLRNEHLKLKPLMDALFLETNPIPVKYALNLMGFNVGTPRLPLHELSSEYRAALQSLMDELQSDPS